MIKYPEEVETSLNSFKKSFDEGIHRLNKQADFLLEWVKEMKEVTKIIEKIARSIIYEQ